MTRYFQGSSVTGPVHASSATTFAEVVAKLNVCPQLPLTRKAFLALPKAVRQEKKHVPFFVAATFKTSPSPRLTDHAGPCNLIFIDIDETADGRCPAAPFVNNPELLYTALEGFNFAAHTTASSTSAKPRMRVVVDADAIPLEAYPQAVETIGALLGLPVLTKESKIPGMPMFLPTQFLDDTEEDHPLIADRTDARAFTVGDIRSTTHHTNGSTPKQKYDDSDSLEFLRAPVPEVTLAIAKEALASIDPDCSYFDWLHVAAALRHQFSPHQGEEAYELFDVWSSEGSKYGGSDDTRAKWDSLRPTPIGRAPVTIRSLLQKASQSGWDDKSIKARGYDAINNWINSVDSISELMEQGIRKILATPLLSFTQEEMLMDQLRSQAKERFGHKASITALRKDMVALREKMQAKAPDDEKRKEPKWTKGLCFVTVPKEFYRPLTGEKYKIDSFDLKYGRKLLPTAKELAAAGIPVNEATLSKPIISPTEYVLNYLKIPVFYDYAYAPQSPTEMLFVHEKRSYVNTYSPTYPEPDAGHATQAGAMFQRHLGNLIAEPDYQRVLTDFMAYLVQHPGKKIRWAVLVQGVEGAGKTYLAEVMKAVLGKRHVKTVDGTTITSGWNEWTFGYQMVVIEEVRVVGTNRHDIMNRLKPWITNEDIPINEKFRSSRDAANITNYMLFSNAHDALSISPGDRRYFVIKSPLQEKSQVLALGKNYFAELFDFLNAHPGAMRSWLMDWPISEDFAPNSQAPRTKYTQELIEDSASELTACVRRLMLEGDHPLVQYDIVSSSALMDLVRESDGLFRVSQQYLGSVLQDEGLRKLSRVTLGTERHYLWARNGLTEEEAAATAKLRLSKGLKNLSMQDFF